jgi:hypothetical protein
MIVTEETARRIADSLERLVAYLGAPPVRRPPPPPQDNAHVAPGCEQFPDGGL